MTVLVLAGTVEARTLIEALVGRGVDVMASLAGRTAAPHPLPCPVRVGGFGGAGGLAHELRARTIHALVDATHPFADEMPEHARAAADEVGIPHLRLVRPPWHPNDGDHWTIVADAAEAARALTGRRALLTLGRQELDPFVNIDGVDLVVRSVDPPPPGPWSAVILGHGPFSYDDELGLLRQQRIDALVTRNSGGPRAKLDAARDAGVAVVMIRRPAPVEAPTVNDVGAAVEWVLRLEP